VKKSFYPRLSFKILVYDFATKFRQLDFLMININQAEGSGSGIFQPESAARQAIMIEPGCELMYSTLLPAMMEDGFSYIFCHIFIAIGELYR